MGRILARLGAALGAALVLLLLVLLAVLPGQGEARAHSVLSAEDDGLRAAYLTLENLGFPVAPWSAAPGELAGPGTVLVLPALPAAPPPLPAALAQADERAQSERPRRGRELAHYRRFVEEGGTLLVPAADADALTFLRDGLGLAALAGLEAVEFEPRGLTVQVGLRGPFQGAGLLTFAGGGAVALADAPLARFSGARADEILARSERDEVLCLRRAAGAGSVVLLGLALEPLENGALAEQPEPALVLVRTLEELAPIERVLFDEYALGGWRPASFTRLAFSPDLAWLSLHALLFGLLLAWRAAWSGPFPRDPERVLAASPLARARGFGRLLARAGRFELLTRLLRTGVLQRWEARAGRRAAGAEDEAVLTARLATLAGGDERLRAQLTGLFVDAAPRDEAELGALDSELCALEGRLFQPREAGKPRRTLGARPARSGS